MPRSSSALSSLPTSPSCSIMPSAYSLPGMPLWPRIDSRTCVKTCMRVVFIQVKNGLLAFACLLMKSIAAAVVSSSMVSIRLLVSGPVSSSLLADRPQCGCRSDRQCRSPCIVTPRGEFALDVGRVVLRPVRALGFFLGVQVVEVAEELVEAVLRSADTRRGRRDGSCRTGRWRSRAASAPGRW